MKSRVTRDVTGWDLPTHRSSALNNGDAVVVDNILHGIIERSASTTGSGSSDLEIVRQIHIFKAEALTTMPLAPLATALYNVSLCMSSYANKISTLGMLVTFATE